MNPITAENVSELGITKHRENGTPTGVLVDANGKPVDGVENDKLLSPLMPLLTKLLENRPDSKK